MKILGISILMLVLLSGFSIVMDTFLGFDLNTSFNNSINPFLVMEVTEIIIFIMLIFIIWAICSTHLFLKKRSKKQ